jgi:hypothetical protein
MFALKVTKRRMRRGFAALRPGPARNRAPIRGKFASAGLYLNKLLRRGGDASLAILSYHSERAINSVV